METTAGSSFVRWQGIVLRQFSYAINLILGFSAAAIAFEVSLFSDPKNREVQWDTLHQSLALASLVLLSISFSVGILLVVNRLQDFQATMSAARARESGSAIAEIEGFRSIYEKLGKRTWRLFRIQIGTFTLGIGALSGLGFLLCFSTVLPPPSQKLDSYAGVALQMSMAKVEYALGLPSEVSYTPAQAALRGKETSEDNVKVDEATALQHFNWSYQKPGGKFVLEVDFDSNTHRVKKIGCYDFTSVDAGDCPSLAGINHSMNVTETIKKLGPPTTRVGDQQSIITYRSLGAFFFIVAGKVAALGIDQDAR